MFANLAAQVTAVTPRCAPTRHESRRCAPGPTRKRFLSVRAASLREDLFGAGSPSIPPTKLRSKVSIVGTGQVGLACAYSMINQGTARELVLHDVASKLEALQAEVEDLRHGAEFVQQVSISATCDFKDTANSDIVIIPAGARQREGESRLDLVARNVAIFESIVPPIAAASPDAVLLILTNPCDVMTHVATQISGFAPNKVIGTGTALDTSRFRALLAEYLDVDSGSVHGMVLGEHGDSSVAVWSQCTVGGVRLMDVHPALGTDEAEAGLKNLHADVIGAAGRIIARKGYTNWALGLTVTSIARCILRDERHVLPLSVPAFGKHGIDVDVCLSLPAMLGAEGVLEVLNMPLTEAEQEAIRRSAATLAEVQSKIVFVEDRQ
jgi:L-lactate dehydrogenase